MSEFLDTASRSLLEAISFAARAHRHQLRKDGVTPYVGHVFRVCLVLRHVFGVTDEKTLMAAVLHDTIEDTTTDFDDLEKHFGHDVATWAATLSKDKRLPEEPREQDYLARLVAAPLPVTLCKLADIYDNLLDSSALKPEQRARSLRRAHQYLDVLTVKLPPEARPAYEIVERLYREMAS